jgi:hypothetical protein
MPLCQKCAGEFTPAAGYELSLNTRASHCTSCRKSMAGAFIAIYCGEVNK